MNYISILTDTDSSIPPEIAEQLNLIQIPISIHFGEETFKSGVNINDKELFQRVDQEDKLPTTSAPAPGIYENAFQEAIENGAREIICFCVSSEVSATYSAAKNASLSFPEGKIHVIDSRSLSMGQGFMVMAAAEAALKGAPTSEILRIAESTSQRTYLFAYLPTLKYLAMSGRVGHVAAGMATLLNVKPILTIQDGKLDLMEKVRTQTKARNRLVELINNALGEKTFERLCLVHVNALEQASEFEEQLREVFTLPKEISYAELTPGLSVHSGAGMLGLAFVVSG